MHEAPQIENVRYDPAVPVLNRGQIGALLMTEDEEEIRSLALELFELFKAESSVKLAEFDQICQARDKESLRDVTHFIAGSAGSLGLMRLSAFCRAIEHAVEGGELKDFEACARYVPLEFELACREFCRGFQFDL